MKLLFKGGTVVSGDGMKRLDILTNGEKIAALGEEISAPEAELVDARGKLIFPGFIDAHTHMALEVCGTVTADGFDSGTKAELAGGTTCIVDYATQYRGESLKRALANWHEKAAGASCDYAFHIAITDWNEDIYKELAETTAEETISYKLYMTYDTMVGDEEIYEILSRLRETGGIAGVHCENDGIIKARLKEAARSEKGRKSPSLYPWTRPAEAEAEAVGRLLKIAKCAEAPVIVVHLSSEAGLREIRRAREEGQKVYVETCPQYLVMDDEKYSLPAAEARRYMIAPPLRGKADREALWRALADGEIQTVATDHCSFTMAQKNAGAEDFSKTPCGMPGAEERPALLWRFGVCGGKISAAQMCALLSENPAKLYGLYPRKGTLAPGADADIVLWNPDAEWTISAKDMQSACDYSPMEGTKIRGRAESVYLRGAKAAEKGKIIMEKMGRYIRHGGR